MGHTWQKVLCSVAVAEWPIAIMSLIISLNHYTVSIGQSTPINSRLGIIFTMSLGNKRRNYKIKHYLHNYGPYHNLSEKAGNLQKDANPEFSPFTEFCLPYGGISRI